MQASSVSSRCRDEWWGSEEHSYTNDQHFSGWRAKRRKEGRSSVWGTWPHDQATSRQGPHSCEHICSALYVRIPFHQLRVYIHIEFDIPFNGLEIWISWIINNSTINWRVQNLSFAHKHWKLNAVKITTSCEFSDYHWKSVLMWKFNRLQDNLCPSLLMQGTCLSLLNGLLVSEDDSDFLRTIVRIPSKPLLQYLEPIIGDGVSESDSGYGNLRRDALMSITARSSSGASNQVTQDEGMAVLGPARLEVPVSNIRTSSINSEQCESSYSGRSLARCA